MDEPGRLRAGSATSWGAILAGALVAISVSLILVVLGAGLGFAAVSPWPNAGASATGFTVAGTIWLIVTQWLSAAVGGYLVGRLRQRWLAMHTHEVFFRDTAHGLVTWSLATLVVATVFAGSAASLLQGGAQATGGVVRGAMASANAAAPDPYDLDKLFRNPAPSGSESSPRLSDAKMEVTHIAASAVTSGAVSAEDRAYLANLVAGTTGAAQEDAQKRVDDFIQSVQAAAAKAKAAADAARKAALSLALYTTLALLIGAFIASVAAAIGGHLRDEHL